MASLRGVSRRGFFEVTNNPSANKGKNGASGSSPDKGLKFLLKICFLARFKPSLGQVKVSQIVMDWTITFAGLAVLIWSTSAVMLRYPSLLGKQVRLVKISPRPCPVHPRDPEGF